MLLQAATDAAGSTYNWVYIVVGIVSLIGGGGLVALIRWLRASAVKDSKLDALIDPEKGVMATLDAQGKILEAHGVALADLKHVVSPNGGRSNNIGDIAKRTEKAVNQLRDNFNQHVGDSNRVHSDLRTELARKQDRV